MTMTIEYDQKLEPELEKLMQQMFLLLEAFGDRLKKNRITVDEAESQILALSKVSTGFSLNHGIKAAA
jgi:hypothetical protein